MPRSPRGGSVSAVIRSELQAYFPDNKKLRTAWDNLDTSVTGVYYVLKNETPQGRLSTFDTFRIAHKPPPHSALIVYSLEHIPNAVLGEYDSDINEDLLFPLLFRQQAINGMILHARSIL